MNETTKAALEQRYRALLVDYRAGRIDRATFVAAADDLHFRDADGRCWAIGLESGEWYCHDGQTWQPGDPVAGERPAIPDREPSAWPGTSPASLRMLGLAATPAKSLLAAGVIFMLILAVLALPAIGAPPDSGPAAQPSPRPPLGGASTDEGGHGGSSGDKSGAGQGAIVGTVTDLSSGGPAAGVLVSVSGYPPISADKDGRFSISNLPAGQYTVALVLSGQGQASQGPVFVSLDGQNRVTIDLTYSSRPQLLPTDTPQAVAAAAPPPASAQPPPGTGAASPREMPSSGAPAGPGPLIIAGLGLVLVLVGGALRLGSRGR
jgi:hypothetical protein